MTAVQRSKLSPELETRKSTLVKAFDVLSSLCGDQCYVSVSAELRRRKNYGITLKGRSAEEEKSEGAVLRVYDGQTIFESAGPLSFDFVHLAEELAQKVRALGQMGKRKYASPSWSERLSRDLEPEIKSQIPESPKADQFVHLGTRIREPLFGSEAQVMSWLESQFGELKRASSGLEPDFLKLGLGLQADEFLFIDSSVRLSQTVNRNLSRLLLTKGESQGRVDQGGLGGAESFHLGPQHFQTVTQKLGDELKAERLTPGRYKVLMGPAITGVFAHEAFGHTQEGDTWARGRSKAAELYVSQTRVGNEHATIMNNPAIYDNGSESSGAWGSYFFDEEGWLAESQVLVEAGYLKPPMATLSSSLRLSVPRSANAKRENWGHAVYTRQTNTYFSAGDQTLEQLMARIDYGFLAEECSGGMEDPKGMGIQVGIKYVKEIRDGRLTGRTFKGPNGGALQMTGYVPDYLNQILGKSLIDPSGQRRDLKHPWNDVGGCAKYHKEVVYAGCGGPYMLLRDVLLG